MLTSHPQRQGPRAAPQPAGARRRQPDRVPARGQVQARLGSRPVSPTATSTRIVLERRFNGPPATANGGYACGVVAKHVDGPAAVSLRRPGPARHAARARAPRRRPRDAARRRDADRRGRPGAAAGLRAARTARPSRRRAKPPPSARRLAGDLRLLLRLRPRTAPTGSAWSSARCRRTRAHRRGAPRAARTCPSGTATSRRRSPGRRSTARATRRRCGAAAQPSLLARMHAELLEPVPAGEAVAVVGWSLATRAASTAAPRRSWPPTGAMLARAEALWIRLRG